MSGLTIGQGVNLGAAFAYIRLDTNDIEKGIKSVTQHFGALGSIAAPVLTGMAAAATGAIVGVTAIGAASVKTAAEVEAAMAVLSTVTDPAQLGLSTTAEAYDKLHDAAQQIGNDLRLFNVDMAQSVEMMTNLTKSGLDSVSMFGDLDAYLAGTAELGGAMRASIDLAAASTLSHGEASRFAATMLATYGTEVEGAANQARFINEALDNTVRAADASTAEVNQLVEAHGNVGPTAHAAGLTLQEVNIALAMLHDRGIRGAEAGTALRSMLTNLTRTTPRVAAQMNELGIELYDAEGRIKSLPEWIETLDQALNGVIISTEMVGGRTEEQNKQLAAAQAAYDAATKAIYEHDKGIKILAEEDLVKMQRQQAAANVEIERLSAITGRAVEKRRELTEIERKQAVHIIAGTYGQQALNSVIAEGVMGYRDMAAAIGNASSMQEIATARTETFYGRLEALRGIIETTREMIGVQLLPILTEMVEKFSEWLSSAEVQDWILRFAENLAVLLERMVEFAQRHGPAAIQVTKNLLIAIAAIGTGTAIIGAVSKISALATAIKGLVAAGAGGNLLATFAGIEKGSSVMMKMGTAAGGLQKAISFLSLTATRFGVALIDLKTAGALVTAAFSGGLGAGTLSGILAGAKAAVLALVGAFGPITVAIAAIGAAVALLAVAWKNDWGGIQEKTAAVLGAIGKAFSPIVEIAQEAGTAISRNFRDAGEALRALSEGRFRDFGATIRRMEDRMDAFGAKMVAILLKAGRDFAAYINELDRQIAEWWAGIGNKIEADGGLGQALVNAIKEDAAQFVEDLKGIDEAIRQVILGYREGFDTEPLERHAVQVQNVTSGYGQMGQNVAIATGKIIGAHGQMVDAGIRTLRTQWEVNDSIFELGDVVNISGDRLERGAEAAAAYSERVHWAGVEADNLARIAETATARITALTAAFATVQAGYVNALPGGDQPLVSPEYMASVTTGGLTPEQNELAEEYRKRIADLNTEISGLTSGLEAYGMTQEEVNEKVSAAAAEAAYYEGLLGPLAAVTGEVSTKQVGLAVNTQAVYTELYKQLLAAEASPQVMVAYATAVGIMTEEQGRAALAAASVQVKIEALATAIAGGMPVDFALRQLESFIAQVNGTFVPTLADVPQRVTEMKDALMEGTGASAEEEAQQVGKRVAAGIQQGVTDALPTVTESSQTMINRMIEEGIATLGAESGVSAEFVALGEAAIQGLTEPLTGESLNTFLAAVGDVGTGMIDTMRTTIGAASPATEFIAIGNDAMAGLMDGMEELREQAVGLAGAIADEALRVMGGVVTGGAPSIGHAIVGGVIAGVNARRGELMAVMRQMALDAYAEAMAAINAASPSRLFMQMGQAIIDGIVEGINEEEDKLYDKLLSVANTLHGIGMAAFDFQSDALQEQIDEAQGTLDGTMESLRGWLTDAQLENIGNLPLAEQIAALKRYRDDPMAFGVTQTPEMIRRLNEAIAAAEARNDLEEEYIRQQQELLALQQAQQQLNLLQMQVDLLNLISEHGLSTDILEGLTLGLGANLTDIIAAMTAAVQEIIAAAEDELGVASPSRVFREIGRRVMEGLEMGIADGGDVMSALQRRLRELQSASTDPFSRPISAAPAVRPPIYIFGGYNPQITTRGSVAADPLVDLYYEGL